MGMFLPLTSSKVSVAVIFLSYLLRRRLYLAQPRSSGSLPSVTLPRLGTTFKNPMTYAAIDALRTIPELMTPRVNTVILPHHAPIVMTMTLRQHYWASTWMRRTTPAHVAVMLSIHQALHARARPFARSLHMIRSLGGTRGAISMMIKRNYPCDPLLSGSTAGATVTIRTTAGATVTLRTTARSCPHGNSAPLRTLSLPSRHRHLP